MSKNFAAVANAIVRGMAAPLPYWLRIAFLARASERITPVAVIETSRGSLRFHTPSKSAVYWPRHGLSDEPGTLAWLDDMRPGDVLWDIGANVGAFAMYAALAGNTVVAFEPNPFSFHALARNIEANGLGDRIKAVCAALSDRTGLGDLLLPGSEAGSVLNAFGADSYTRGRSTANDLRFSVPGITVDDFLAIFSPPPPTHIKIDVDGIEERIVVGAARALADPHVRSVLIEIDSGNKEQEATIFDLMARADFRIGARTHFAVPQFFNQVFERDAQGFVSSPRT